MGDTAEDDRGRLPDIPGKVHGIVQLEPFIRIQCDGCGFIHDGEPGKVALAILTCGILFSPKRYHGVDGQRDTRRLCRDCRESEWDGKATTSRAASTAQEGHPND
jgi:hypothetical protein